MPRKPYSACGPDNRLTAPSLVDGTENYLTNVEFVLGSPTVNLYRGVGNASPITRPLAANFIISGLSVGLGSNPNARDITWTSGVYQLGEKRVPTSGGTKQLDLGPTASGERRIDLIYMDTGGALQIVSGTPGSDPSAPYASLPSDRFREVLLLGEVGVENGADATGGYTLTLVNFDTGGITVPNATTTVRGISRYATQAEVDAGTNADSIVTPATLSAWGEPLPAANDDALLWRQNGVWQASSNGFGSSGISFYQTSSQNSLFVRASYSQTFSTIEASYPGGGISSAQVTSSKALFRLKTPSNDIFQISKFTGKPAQIDAGTFSDFWLRFNAGYALEVGSLAGSGTRMVTTDANGVLGSQAIPMGLPAGSATNDILRWDGGSWGSTNGIQVPVSGAPTIPSLGGSGSQMVTVNNAGTLGVQAIPQALPAAEQYTLAVNTGTLGSPNWEDTQIGTDDWLKYNTTTRSLTLRTPTSQSGQMRVEGPVGTTGIAWMWASDNEGFLSCSGAEGVIRVNANTNGKSIDIGLGATLMLLGVGPSSPTAGNQGDDLMATDYIFRTRGRQQKRVYMDASNATIEPRTEVAIVDSSSSAGTAILPDLSTLSLADGHVLTVKRKGANTVTLDTQNTETIEGVSTYILDCDGDAVVLSYDAANTNWDILNEYKTNNCP